MTIFDRYLARAVIGGTLLVLLALTTLAAFFSLIGEADKIGQGNYGMANALLFVVLNMPRHAYELFPIAVLLGALLGLGNLASGNELTVMRAAGVSVSRLGVAVLYGGLVLALLCVALGEVLAPPAERYAHYMQTQALYQRAGLGAAQGIWIREGNSFANIRQMNAAGELRDVYIYNFSGQQNLQSASRASTMEYSQDKWWLLHRERTRFGIQNHTISSQTGSGEKVSWNITLDPALLELFVVDSDTLSALELHRYINYLQDSNLNAAGYKMAFWLHWVIPVSVFVMAALALPFVFGPLRSVGAGQRVIFGLLIGIGFYVLNQTLANSGQVFGLPPALVIWTPTVLVGLGTAIALKRIR